MSSNDSLETYLNVLYGDDYVGWVYAPHRFIDSTQFIPEWFHWPYEKERMARHLLDCEDNDQFISPVLWDNQAFSFGRSNVLWADFDGNAPDETDFAVPTLTVQSSIEGHEHWYWKLSEPISDPDELEMYNRRLSRLIKSDKVAWNRTRILRPPGTINHKRDERVILLDSYESYTVSKRQLLRLPEVQANTKEDTSWEWELEQGDFDAIRPSLTAFIDAEEPEHRAQALFSIATSLIEYSWTRNAVMTVLNDCAFRWDKWTDRNDRDERLKSLYNSALSSLNVGTNDVAKGAAVVESVDETLLPLSTTSEILAVEDEQDWILKDLLAKQGFMIISAQPGVGKTTMGLNLMLAMATGSRFLDWDIPHPIKSIFFSLEMNQKGLKKFVGKMVNEYPDQLEQIDENLRFYNGYSYRLNSQENRNRLLSTIDREGADGIVFDSLSRISDDLNDKQSIDVIFDFISEELIKKRDMFVIIIHHEGKGSAQGDVRQASQRMYGSQFIPAWIDTGISLQPIKIDTDMVPGVKFTISKSRYSEYLSPINCYRNENLILKRFEERYIR